VSTIQETAWQQLPGRDLNDMGYELKVLWILSSFLDYAAMPRILKTRMLRLQENLNVFQIAQKMLEKHEPK
jgi:hypothetical protein